MKLERYVLRKEVESSSNCRASDQLLQWVMQLCLFQSKCTPCANTIIYKALFTAVVLYPKVIYWLSWRMLSVSICFAACQWARVQPVWWPQIIWGRCCVFDIKNLNLSELGPELTRTIHTSTFPFFRKQVKAAAC